LVCETVTENVPTTETYCEQVPYQYTVRVLVNGGAPMAGYDDGYYGGGSGGGLFGGRGGLFGGKHR
jgi:hypothetical protein